jgi:predicted dehydrogenase
MAKKKVLNYRVGVIGFAHMHVNSLIKNFSDLPNVTWVACADTKPISPSFSEQKSTRKYNIKKTLKEVDMPRFYEDYNEMLQKEEFDIIIVCSENQQHAEVVEAIAAKKIHILVEKPMSNNMSGALKMYRAVKNAGTSLAINWPATWNPEIRKAFDIVNTGEIGDVWEFKYRNRSSLGPFSHGESLPESEMASEWWYQTAAGGGAFLDYCCYGACLARWFLGKPAFAAQGTKINVMSHFADTEDNGIIVARFNTALAILEGTWSTTHAGIANGPIVYGTKGTLVVDVDKILVYKDRYSAKPTKVYEGEPIQENRNNAAKECFSAIKSLQLTVPITTLLISLSIS